MLVFSSSLSAAVPASVERLLHFATVPSEAPYFEDLDTELQDKRWPQHGAINFNHLSMRYRPGLPLVLKDITFHVKPGEKIGICGRTGLR